MKKIIWGLLIIVFAFGVGWEIVNLTSGSNATENQNKQTISNLSPTQFLQAINSKRYQLLDIRTQEEFAAGHLAGAAQIDYYQTQAFSDYLDKLDKKSKYLIYCRTGHRSGLALKIMQDKGFINVSDMTGGYNAWIANGSPITQE